MQRIGDPLVYARKLWELCFISQALWERGMLQPGRKGLGFAVGNELLAALFASFGCEIVATDLHDDKASIWIETDQHASSLDGLNQFGLCDAELFQRNVTFRHVDMNDIPSDLAGFDFCWSSCAFEHLGSIEHGKQFIYNMTRCLKPGGVGVHTTEFNVSSNTHTREVHPGFVIFRKRDIEDIVDGLRAMGHHIEVDFQLGDGPIDQYVDKKPFCQEPIRHLKVQFDEYVCTSIGLIIDIRQ
jgi:hypothetical protein